LNDRETFEKIFPFLSSTGSGNAAGVKKSAKEEAAFLCQQVSDSDLIPLSKALRNWKIFLKALSKRLRKLRQNDYGD